MWISKKKFIELLQEASDRAYLAGIKTGRIKEKAESMGMGYILEGTKIEKEINEIMKKVGF